MSACSFQFFCDGEHLGHAVPVSGGAGGLYQLLDRRPRQLGLTGPVGKVDVEFAAQEMQFLGIILEFEECGGRFGARITSEECQQQFAGLTSDSGERKNSLRTGL